jgi:putative sterol carrier protein
MNVMVRYLSLDWIDAVATNVATNEQLGKLAGEHEIGFTQVVSGGPEGDVTYHLQVGDGRIHFAAGPADPEHVRMEQTWDTAVAVATGSLNAQEAFVNGHIRLYGDQQRLLDSQPVFGALDSVFSAVREQTSYA